VPRPAANDTDSGTQIASAARFISGHGHGTGARDAAWADYLRRMLAVATQ
jgi:hypothetical protein